MHDFGITNALATTQSFLLSSSLDLDTGTSSINIRSLPDLNYLGSLKLPNFGRILCLATVEDEGNKSIRMAVGGTKLVLIETRGIGCRRSPKFVLQDFLTSHYYLYRQSLMFTYKNLGKTVF